MKKILVVLPNWVGDAVIAEPLLQSFAANGTQVHVLSHPPVAEIAALMPSVSRVITPPFSRRGLKFWPRWHFARQVLAAMNYDAAVVLPNSWKSALMPFFAGIKRRIGYRGEARYGLINRMHFDMQQSTAQAWTGAHRRRAMAGFYAALAYPPTATPPQKIALPQLQLPADAPIPLSLQGHSPYVVFACGAEFGPAKRWGAPRFAALARCLLQSHAIKTVVLLGSLKDQAEAAAIAQALAESSGSQYPAAALQNLCGKTTLTEAAAVLAGSAFVVSNDSGLKHGLLQCCGHVH